jgi:uncharacterized protein YkwD
MKNKTTKTLTAAVYIGFVFFVLALTSSKAISADRIPTEFYNSIHLVNQIREGNGLTDLTWNETLAKAAQNKAQDMVVNNYFEHVSPTGKTAWNFVSEAGYNYKSAGENLAIDFTNVNDATVAWTKSPSHMANIVSKKYSEFGFGEAKNSSNEQIYVQIFASSQNQYEEMFSSLINGQNSN